MFKRLIYVMTFVLALSSTAHAAVYLWNGSAADGLWDTPANWTVIDSAWTWPNEEAVLDPNANDRNINDDTVAIDILDGSAVSRTSRVAIQGAADGSTTAVLTLNNASSLTVDGRLAVGDRNGTKGQIDILGGSTVTITGDGSDLTVADADDTWALVNIVDSIVNIADDINIDQGEGHVNIGGNSILNYDGMNISANPQVVGFLNISGNAVLNGSSDIKTDEGEGHIVITDNAVLEIDDLYIVDNDNGIGSLEVSGNATINCDDFKLVDDPNGIGTLVVSGNASITIRDDFFGNDDSGDPSANTITLDGGTVSVNDDCTFNDDNPGMTTVTINSGSWISGDDITVSDNLDGTAHVTINGGEMICNDLKLGDSGGEDIGQIRVNLNGGTLQANNLSIAITDTLITYTGGQFRVASADVNEVDMQQLITDGTIVADGAYSIVTDGDYTVLNPWLPTEAKLPNPADGTEGVLLGTTLSWLAGDTAATHDVYFGTSSPPTFIGNQEAATYYQPIEVGTTYYWQIDEVEADGTTKHAGDVWSFTATTDLSTVSEVATQPSPADGAISVALDAILSWWPGASAVSHDVYFGTTSITELSFDPGPLEEGTTYYWWVDAVAADGTIHAGDVWSFSTLTPPPPEWTSLDIATTGGTTSYDPTTGTFTIMAGGADIWNNADEFQFCYQQPTLTRGDCTLIANVVSFPVPDGGDNWQKAGLMIRDTLDAGSKNAFIAITGGSGDGATFQWRPDTDGGCSSSRTLVMPPPPASIKLVREGDTFTGYILLDGQWQQQGESTTIVMGDEVYVGLAVTSHKAGLLATVVIDNVSITTPNPNIAASPDPADGAIEVPKTPTLSWIPGATTVSRDVYLSADEQAVIDGTAPVTTVTEASYSPAKLDGGVTYYWRVDEVEADGTTHTSDVWSFTVTTLGR